MHLVLPSFTLDLPDGGVDGSVVVVADPSEPPLWHLQVRSDPLPGGITGLAAYVAAQRFADGAVVEGRDTSDGKDGAPRIVVRLQLDVDGETLRQHIGFVGLVDVVAIVTMTSRDWAGARAVALFQHTLNSIGRRITP